MKLVNWFLLRVFGIKPKPKQPLTPNGKVETTPVPKGANGETQWTGDKSSPPWPEYIEDHM